MPKLFMLHGRAGGLITPKTVSEGISMQTMGYIWLFDREGNKQREVQVLFRRNKNYALLKMRKNSKDKGSHFIDEEGYIQSLRFALNQDDNKEAEKHYQELVNGFLDQGETIYC